MMKKIIFLFVLAFSFVQCQVDVEPEKVDESTIVDDKPMSRLGSSSYCEPEIDPNCQLITGNIATFTNVDLLEPCSECDMVTLEYALQICHHPDGTLKSAQIFDVDLYFCTQWPACTGNDLDDDLNAIQLVLTDLLSKLSVALELRVVETHIGPHNKCPTRHFQITSYQRSCYYSVPDMPLQYCGEKCCSRLTSYCWLKDENGNFNLTVTPIENIESGDCGVLVGNDQIYECQNECALGIVRLPDPVETDEF